MTTQAKITDETILDCGHKPSPHDNFATGYGYDTDNHTFCYECAAQRDREFMRSNGHIVLYLATEPNGDCRVSNWPGSLEFKGRYRVGNHNIAGKRYDCWFVGPDAKTWHGVTYGDMTQICHCRVTL